MHFQWSSPDPYVITLFSLFLILAFFSILHSWLNAFAEMLRFGDRLFYRVSNCLLYFSRVYYTVEPFWATISGQGKIVSENRVQISNGSLASIICSGEGEKRRPLRGCSWDVRIT